MTATEREIIRAGPYKADSLANGEILITPAWPGHPDKGKPDGTGPGLGELMEVAAAIERTLNGILRADKRSKRRRGGK